MGQRHQLFVIAKTRFRGWKKARYVPIAVVHHGWLFGRSSVYATFRFLSLILNPHNARLVQHELDSFQSQPFKNLLDRGQREEVRAPFVSYLLELAASLSLKEPLPGGMSNEKWQDYYCSRAHIDNPSFNPSQYHNNDGWTIFDLTQPLHPRYAYAANSIDASYGQLPRYEPCSAEQFVRCYYPAPSELLSSDLGLEEKDIWAVENEVQRRITGIQSSGCELVSIEAMVEAWPGEKGFQRTLQGQIMSVLANKGEGDKATTPEADHNNYVESLSASSLRKMLDHALEENDPSVLGQAQSLLENSIQESLFVLRETIIKNQSCEFYNKTGVVLLATFFNLELKSPNPPKDGDQVLLDFSKFALDSSLKGDQVVETIENLIEMRKKNNNNASMILPPVRMLDISLIRDISTSHILSICKLMPSIAYITAIDCPLLTRSSIDAMLKTPQAASLSLSHQLISLQTYSTDNEDIGDTSSPPRSFVFVVSVGGKPNMGKQWIGSSHTFFPGAYNIISNIRSWIDWNEKDTMGEIKRDSWHPQRILGDVALETTKNPQQQPTSSSSSSRLSVTGRPILGRGFGPSGTELIDCPGSCWAFIITDFYQTGPSKWAFARRLPQHPSSTASSPSSNPQCDDIEVADLSSFLDAIAPGWKEEKEPQSAADNNYHGGENDGLRANVEELERLLSESNEKDGPKWILMTKEEAKKQVEQYENFFQDPNNNFAMFQDNLA